MTFFSPPAYSLSCSGKETFAPLFLQSRFHSKFFVRKEGFPFASFPFRVAERKKCGSPFPSKLLFRFEWFLHCVPKKCVKKRGRNSDSSPTFFNRFPFFLKIIDFDFAFLLTPYFCKIPQKLQFYGTIFNKEEKLRENTTKCCKIIQNITKFLQFFVDKPATAFYNGSNRQPCQTTKTYLL